MPKVTFIIDGAPHIAEFEHGQLPYTHHGKPESFLDVAKHFGIPLEHACGGSCACTTCHVIIKQGEQHLSEMEDDEADRLDTAWGLTARWHSMASTMIPRRRTSRSSKRSRWPGTRNGKTRNEQRRHLPPGDARLF